MEESRISHIAARMAGDHQSAAMVKYEVRVKYVQYGTVVVKANSDEEAKTLALDIGPTDDFNIEEAEVIGIKPIS